MLAWGQLAGMLARFEMGTPGFRALLEEPPAPT